MNYNDKKAIQVSNKKERVAGRKKQQPQPKLNAYYLSDYYSDKKITAQQFLKSLQENKINKIPDEDQQQAYEKIDELDSQFKRTLFLLFQSQKMQHSPLTVSCKAFAVESAKKQAERHYGFTVNVNTQPASIFEAFLHAAKSAFSGKKPDLRALNLIKSFGLWLSESRSLEVFNIIQALSFILSGDKKQQSGTEKVSKQQVAMLFNPKTTPAIIRNYVVFGGIGLDVTQTAKNNETKVRDRLQQEQQQNESLNTNLNLVKQELDDALAKIQELSEEIEQLKSHQLAQEQALAEHQEVSTHTHSELKSHARAFLLRKIYPLLGEAKDFIDINPPRIHVVKERLEQTFKAIEDEIQWLKSSD